MKTFALFWISIRSKEQARFLAIGAMLMKHCENYLLRKLGEAIFLPEFLCVICKLMNCKHFNLILLMTSYNVFLGESS